MTTSKTARIFLTVLLLVEFSGVGIAADGSSKPPRQAEDIKTTRSVIQRESARMPLDIVRWVASKIHGRTRVRTSVYANGGKSFSENAIGNVSISPVVGGLNLSTWRERSPIVMAQSSTMIAMIQILDRDEKIDGSLLADDNHDFNDFLEPPKGHR